MNNALPVEGKAWSFCLSGSKAEAGVGVGFNPGMGLKRKVEGVDRRTAHPGRKEGPTWVLTPKSHNLTCPLVFTSMLDGFTS